MGGDGQEEATAAQTGDGGAVEPGVGDLFGSFASNVDLGFAVMDVAAEPRRHLYVNLAYRDIFGFADDGPLPTPADAAAIIHGADLDRARSMMTDTAAGRAAQQEWRILRDGAERWIAGKAWPIRDEDGVVRRIAGIFEDVTERRAADDALRQSRDALDQFARASGVGIAIWEDGRGIVYANPGLYRLLGLDPSRPLTVDDVIGSLHPEDAVKMRSAVEAAAEQDSFVSGLELRIVRPDGETRWLRMRNDLLVEADSAARRIAATFSDITDLKVAEATARSAQAAAEQANATKDEFLSRVSHELRTPLNAILGFGQLLGLDDLRADQRDSVDHIIAAGAHLLGLIDEVLDISRIETGAMRLSLEPVSVREVVDEAVGMLRPLAARRGVRVDLDLPSLDLHARADRQRFKQVLVNLISNAVKYNHDGGQVHVAGELVEAGHLRVTVRDTGVGIAGEDMDRLFRPFERLGAQPSDVEGTGLGLALSRELMTAMEGEVGVVSILGAGSSFWAQLPATSDPVMRRGSGPVASGVPTGAAGRGTVLYVEDHLSNVRLMERVMERRPDVDLMVAMQGHLAVELAVEHQPDLILLDLHLPDMSGEEVLRRLLAEPRTATTPVVMLSADATAGRSKQLLRLGAVDFLTKPFDIDRLLALVDRFGPKSPPAPEAPSTPAAPVAESLAGELGADGVLGFVHDFSNLLNIILNYCALLETSLNDPIAAQDLEQIRIAAQRATVLTRRLPSAVRGEPPAPSPT